MCLPKDVCFGKDSCSVMLLESMSSLIGCSQQQDGTDPKSNEVVETGWKNADSDPCVAHSRLRMKLFRISVDGQAAASVDL